MKIALPLKKTKKVTVSQAKKKAWTAFSLYIRTRDAIRTTGTKENCKCVTCGRVYPLKSLGGLQAGHFIAGRHNSILFDERNVHAQCYGCNVMKKGNTTEYWLFMEKEYGRPVIDELLELDKETKQFKVFELEELETTYKQKLNNMLSLKDEADKTIPQGKC